MTFPLLPSSNHQLLPDYRWVNVVRHVNLVIGFLFFMVVAMSISFGIEEPNIGLNVLIVVLVSIGFPVLIFFGYFRWVPLKRSSRNALEEQAAKEAFAFSGTAFQISGNHAPDVQGAGWILLTDDSLTLWRADTQWRFRSQARLLKTIALDDITACKRLVVSKGRAYPRLRIETLSDDVLDVALTARSGRSVRGPSDAEVDEVVRQIASPGRSP